LTVPTIGSSAQDRTNDPAKRLEYSSTQHWFLRGENLAPFGRNPFFYPIAPGHKHIFERTDVSGEQHRRETMVLDKTEPFDIEGIGKFEAAIVQDEEFIDEDLAFRIHSWVAFDKTTNSIFIFGQTSWEIDDEGDDTVADTWRAGEHDSGSAVLPGLLMPGILAIGARFLSGGKENEPIGGVVIEAAGVDATVPAGAFKGCVRIREQKWIDDRRDIDRTWCPHVGLVEDSAAGALIGSNALPPSHPGGDVSSFGKFAQDKTPSTPPVPKISADEAKERALKVVQGRVTSVVIERKRGKHVYVVEILSPASGEKDVLVDIETGEVIGTE
jgi:hypothetical protein